MTADDGVEGADGVEGVAGVEVKPVAGLIGAEITGSTWRPGRWTTRWSR